MADLCEGGNEPPCSLKASLFGRIFSYLNLFLMVWAETRTPEAIWMSFNRSLAVFVRCRRADMTMYLSWRRCKIPWPASIKEWKEENVDPKFVAKTLRW
ncbi:hypothetical protein ANN_03033 [Periplaneta americana]|uniref:Uncharacterized protein n=1 Tax=Periplaneta americana TaxID=6978 RepID=A0ABQ8U1P3_PERAM|nr:hypothetical protein ANN_03033 [Periplaneta americana]